MRAGITQRVARNGWWEMYTTWTDHGEAPTINYPSFFHRDKTGPSNSGDVDPNYMDPRRTFLNDVFSFWKGST